MHEGGQCCTAPGELIAMKTQFFQSLNGDPNEYEARKVTLGGYRSSWFSLFSLHPTPLHWSSEFLVRNLLPSAAKELRKWDALAMMLVAALQMIRFHGISITDPSVVMQTCQIAINQNYWESAFWVVWASIPENELFLWAIWRSSGILDYIILRPRGNRVIW